MSDYYETHDAYRGSPTDYDASQCSACGHGHGGVTSRAVSVDRKTAAVGAGALALGYLLTR